MTEETDLEGGLDSPPALSSGCDREPGVEVEACNPSTWETKAKGSRV